MSISRKDLKILWGKAGNQCSMPYCTEFLSDDNITYGEMAHIIAKSVSGPRSKGNRGLDSYNNFILLCERHHREIDENPEEYPPERLHYIKKRHEEWVAKSIEKSKDFTKSGALIVFCGASSVGKDVVASRVKRDLRDKFNIEIDFLNKYTTREMRCEKWPPMP